MGIITRSTLSRLEAQDDMYVTTLQRIVESLGGRLEIVARHAERPTRLGH